MIEERQRRVNEMYELDRLTRAEYQVRCAELDGSSGSWTLRPSR